MRILVVRLVFATLIGSTLATAALAQERLPPLADVLNLDATVTSEVAPDLAIITLAVVREGVEVAPLTRDVNATLAKAFADAKAVPGVIASNGAYSTFPRYETRNNQNVRTGWQVRAEIMLKSSDFNAIGVLAGKLSDTMQVSSSSFEISPELRAKESSALIERAARAFQDKAAAGAKAFGYAGYSIVQVTIGDAGQSGNPRPMMMAARLLKQDAAPLPVESGRVTLSVNVTGAVQMKR